MSDRIIFISARCEYCEKLLVGIREYDILKRMFSIVNIDSEPFPNYIKSVPTLLMNNQLVVGEELFEYMSRIIDSTMDQNQQQEPQQQQEQQQQEPQQQQQGTCSKEDEIMGYCTNGSCIDFSPITDINDDYTNRFQPNLTNVEFLDGQADEGTTTQSNVQLSKDDTFDRSDKRKEFDSDYERLMNDRKL